MKLKRISFKNLVLALLIVSMIALASIPVRAALGDQLLRRGTSHNDVKVLQQRLKDLGFFNYSGGTTTYYGPVTEKAVKDFQRSKGLVADGIFGPATLKALNAADGNSASAQPAPSSPSNPPGSLVYSSLLRIGSRGQDVRNLQETLNSLAYNCGKADGIFGNATYNAVVNFQRAQNLSPDGIVGPQTVNALNNKPGNTPEKPKPSTPNRGEGSSNMGVDIVNTAKKYLGIPYIYAGSTIAGFDCSGFTQFVYGQFGISIPRTSTAQAGAGSKVERSNLQVGDLVIFSDTYKPGPSHTGIYIGNSQFIHSSSGGGQVIISSLNSAYYNTRFSYGRKLF